MSLAPTRPRAMRWCPPAVAAAAAVLATLLVLMFAGHQMSASGGHHTAGCAHAAGTGIPAGPLDVTSPGPVAVPGTIAGDAHLTQGDCSGNCGAVLICTIFLAAVLLAAGLAARRAGAGRPVRVSWARIPCLVSVRGLVPSPDLVALGISRT